MSSAKKSRAKSGAKLKPAIESAGNLTLRNFWVKIGFSLEELKALTRITTLFEQKKYKTTGIAARLVLTTALTHWDVLEPLAFADEKYMEDEGFTNKELFRQKIIAQKFNLPQSGRAK